MKGSMDPNKTRFMVDIEVRAIPLDDGSLNTAEKIEIQQINVRLGSMAYRLKNNLLKWLIHDCQESYNCRNILKKINEGGPDD